jgi:hypothetical protein
VHHDGSRADLGGGVAGVLEDLPTRDSNPVVVGADVDQIRRVYVKGDLGGPQLICIISRKWLLP